MRIFKQLKSKKKFYESELLRLNCNKAKNILKWRCILTLNETISLVANWYKKYYSDSKKIQETTFNQIKEYEKLLIKRLTK